MPCSCPGSRVEAGRRSRPWPWPWPGPPLMAALPQLLLLLALVSVPSSPAPFQGDPAPGRSPGPPGPPDPTSTALPATTRTTTASPTRTPPVKTSPAPAPHWCSGFEALGSLVLDAPPHHAVNLSLAHGLFQPGHGLVRSVKYRGKGTSIPHDRETVRFILPFPVTLAMMLLVVLAYSKRGHRKSILQRVDLLHACYIRCAKKYSECVEYLRNPAFSCTRQRGSVRLW